MKEQILQFIGSNYSTLWMFTLAILGGGVALGIVGLVRR